jgi:hypothetical protein
MTLPGLLVTVLRGRVPRPATIVLDREGVVRWVSLSDNYQIRPDPRDVLRAVRGLPR